MRRTGPAVVEVGGVESCILLLPLAVACPVTHLRGRRIGSGAGVWGPGPAVSGMRNPGGTVGGSKRQVEWRVTPWSIQ